jgi:hypothetical protein
MPLIIRIDVDRPYGREPLGRHLLSRLGSDMYFPRIAGFGFLSELQTMLRWLNEAGAQAYVFFRRCTLPSRPILGLLKAGRHEIGLHLENSRNFGTFRDELDLLERHTGTRILAISKHGSGGGKFGLHHYPPYEPERYTEWAQEASLRLFLGNSQDPTLGPVFVGNGLRVFPSAFWLEPYWRDTERFTLNWLLEHAAERDIVLLVHPENVLADAGLTGAFKSLIGRLQSRILS